MRATATHLFQHVGVAAKLVVREDLDVDAALRFGSDAVRRFLRTDVQGMRDGQVVPVLQREVGGVRKARKAGLHIMRELFPSLAVLGIREGRDDAKTNYRLVRGLLEQHADLLGLYNIGGASDGVGRALKEAGRGHDLVFVGHGLTSDTRMMLIDGTLDAIITQYPHPTVLNCVRIFANVARPVERRRELGRRGVTRRLQESCSPSFEVSISSFNCAVALAMGILLETKRPRMTGVAGRVYRSSREVHVGLGEMMHAGLLRLQLVR